MASPRDKILSHGHLGLRAPDIIQNIGEILTQLALGYVPVYANPMESDPRHNSKAPPEKRVNPLAIATGRQQMPSATIYRPIEKDDLARLQLILNSYFRLLSKVLPDLKAMELNDITARTDAALTPVDLARQVRGLLAVEQARSSTPADPSLKSVQGERLQ